MSPSIKLVLDKIKSAVAGIDSSAEVYVYGSRARGDERSDSDLDILILIDSGADLAREKLFRHRLYEIELEEGIALSTMVNNKSDWNLRHWMTPLYKNIAKEGIRI